MAHKYQCFDKVFAVVELTVCQTLKRPISSCHRPPCADVSNNEFESPNDRLLRLDN